MPRKGFIVGQGPFAGSSLNNANPQTHQIVLKIAKTFLVLLVEYKQIVEKNSHKKILTPKKAFFGWFG